MHKLRNVILGVVEFGFVVLAIFGFLCIVSEADPWTMGAQIWLSIKGALCIGIGVLGCAFIENMEEAKR